MFWDSSKQEARQLGPGVLQYCILNREIKISRFWSHQIQGEDLAIIFSTPCPRGNKTVMEEFVRLHSYCTKLLPLLFWQVFFHPFHLLICSSPDSFSFLQYVNVSLAYFLFSFVIGATLHQISDWEWSNIYVIQIMGFYVKENVELLTTK